jgi:hypothetical protein
MSATKLTVGDVTITVEHTPQPTVTPAGAFPAHTYTEWSKDLVIGRLQQQEAENVKLANRCDELAREYSELRASAGVETRRAQIAEAKLRELRVAIMPDVGQEWDHGAYVQHAIDTREAIESRKSKAPRSKKGRAA